MPNRRPNDETLDQKLLRTKRRRYQKEKDGQIYMIRGRLRNGDVIWKLGRSVDGERRIRQHKARCRIARWTTKTIWDVKKYVRTEALIHIRLQMLGFQHYERECPCGVNHDEWFTYANSRTGMRNVRDVVAEYEYH
ncbi:hypothetical protein PQX77_019636 [Marasmius sp. AFHP31]|nr:hypothetical protein PQX77_019636 [Marasmius sp. AFHP31]